MPEATVLGADCKLYINDVDLSGGSGTIALPNWIEMDFVRDVELVLGFSEADVTTRAAGGIEIVEPALQQVSITALIKWLNGNTTLEQIYDLMNGRSAMDLWCLTGARTNADARGVRGDFKITGAPMPQNLAESVELNVTLKPCRSTRENYVASADGVGA